MAVVIFKPPEINITAELMWVALPLLVASLMMTLRKAIIVAVSYIAFIILLAAVGSFGYETYAPLLAYLVSISFFVITITHVRMQDQTEIENQLKERQQAEKALRESEEKFSKAFMLSPQEICVTSLKDGRTVEINENFTRLSGFAREDIIGRTSTEVGIWTKPGDREKMTKLLKKNGRVQNEEFEFRDKDGAIRTHLFSAGLINFNNEECIISIMTDITDRKKAELALKESEEKFHSIVEHGNDGIVFIQNGLVQYCNSKMLEIGNYNENDVLGKPFLDFIAPEDKQMVLDIYRERIAGKKTKERYDLNMLAKGNRKVYAEISASLISYQQNQVDIVIVRDVTERRKAQETLRESEERFRQIFQQGPLGIMLSGLDYHITIMNAQFCKMFGYTEQELRSMTFKDLSFPEDVEIDKSYLEKLVKGEITHISREKRYIKKNKKLMWGSLTVTLLRDESEKPISFLAMIEDITQRKMTEEALQESGKEFSKAFQAIPEAISITNKESTKFIVVNDNFCSLTGYSREEAIGRSSQELNLWVNPDDHQRITQLIEKNSPFANEEFLMQSKSGEQHYVLITTDHIDFGGEPCLLVVRNDITERKKAEENLKLTMASLERSTAQLQATNKELESFSYSVSHDLRSPLRSIDGFSQALLEDYTAKLDETGKDYLNRLRNASQKMGELIDGLLRLSRLTRSEMHKEKVDLGALAKDIIDRLKETHPKRHVKVILDSDLTANADPQMMRALLENLLGNAWKFTAKTQNAEIELGRSANGAQKTFFIRDNGAGFDMAFKDKLFGAFQRLHGATEFPGTGIGLATVQRIINRHGGTISAEGAVGKGTTFYFSLNEEA